MKHALESYRQAERLARQARAAKLDNEIKLGISAPMSSGVRHDFLNRMAPVDAEAALRLAKRDGIPVDAAVARVVGK
jgi:hypothetical protein